MRIVDSGNVGVGTTTPNQTLSVNGNAYVGTYLGVGTAPATDRTIWAKNSAGSGTNNAIVADAVGASTQNTAIYANATGATTNYAIYSNAGLNYFAGNVGIGTTSPQYLLQVGNSSVSGIVARFQNSNGTCDINPTTNTLACSSDERLKKDITPMGDELSEVMQLQPVYFNWNGEATGTPEHPGFIAQEVQQVMPAVVSTDPTTGLLSIGYSDLVPAMARAMQQMQAEITTLQGGISGNATTSNLSVYDPSNFSGDSVGQAEIPTGQTSVRITFTQSYKYQPIVTSICLPA